MLLWLKLLLEMYRRYVRYIARVSPIKFACLARHTGEKGRRAIGTHSSYDYILKKKSKHIKTWLKDRVIKPKLLKKKYKKK